MFKSTVQSTGNPSIYIVAYLLKARTVEPAEMIVAWEWLCKQTPFARQGLNDHQVIAATAAHTTIAELLEAVFSVQPVLRLHNSNPEAMKSGCEPIKGDGLEAVVSEFSPGANS
jgi:hypothetical protein